MSALDKRPSARQGRDRRSSPVRTSAPIAAQFEDCLQSYDQLRSAMQTNGSAWGIWYTIVDDDSSRLQLWGKSTGASSRSLDHSLDHALRKASRLRETTLQLLTELYESLQSALDGVRDAARYISENPDEKVILSSVITSGNSAEGSSSPRSEVENCLEEVHEVVHCLCCLGPTLQDPIGQDVYIREYSDDSLSRDRELAQSMFPKASDALIRRLARANWKRRQYVNYIRNQRSNEVVRESQMPAYSASAKVKSLKDFAESFSLLKPRLPSRQMPPARRKRGKISSHGSFEAGPPSTHDTVFSRVPFKESQSITSFPQSEEIGKDSQIPVPRAPTALISGNEFSCPYCRQDIVVGEQISSEQEWAQHIFVDVEPYLCTSDTCPRTDKTYGLRDEWFKHELQCHRIPKVWLCQACSQRFDLEEAFGQHLREKHGNAFGPNEVANMIAFCEGYSASPFSPQICPLCGLSFDSVDAFKDHVAVHLEQLALTSVMSDNGLDCGDDVSESSSVGESESRIKLEILNDFVREQLEYIRPAAQVPPDIDQDEANMDFIEDSEEDSEEEGIGRKSRPIMTNLKVAEDTWKTKVANWSIIQDHSIKAKLEAPPAMPREAAQLDDQNLKVTPGVETLHTNLPPKHDNFVGRDSDLAKIHKLLSVPGQNCVLSGAGGIGKTATAVEYTHRFQYEYSYIFWCQAETSIGCADTYSLIATQLHLSQDPEVRTDLERLVMLSREFLEQTKKHWLLVFDNVDSWSSIIQYLPTNSEGLNGSVLITTRTVDLGQHLAPSHFTKVELSVMLLEDSRHLLLSTMQPDLQPKDLASHPEYNLAGDVASLAERLPLALTLIAGYIQVSKCTLSEFIELWNERLRNTRGSMRALDPIASSSTDRALQTVWSIGLRELSGDARDLIYILAFLDNDTIQKKVLVDKHEEACLEFLHSAEAFRYRRMTTELIKRRLISTKFQDGQEILSIHRLLQCKILQELDRDTQKRWEVFSQAFTLVRKRFPRPSPIQVPDPSKWNACKECLQHVLSLRRIFVDCLAKSPPIIGSLEFSQLLYDAGFNCWEREMTHDGLLLLETAEIILNGLNYDPHARLRADIHAIGGIIRDNVGISKKREGLEQRLKALEIRQWVVDNNPSNVARDDEILLYNAKNDVAESLLQSYEYSEAAILIEQCREQYQKWGTEDEYPFEYAKYYHNIGTVRMLQKRFDEAIACTQRALDLTRKDTGIGPRYLFYLYDMACYVLQAGDKEKALKLHKEVKELREEICGEYNDVTLQSCYTVGVLYHHLGDMDQAEKWIRLSLTRAEKAHWPEEPLCRAQFHLAKILQMSEPESAEAAHLESRARKVLLRLIQYDMPGYLKDVKDEMILFNHLQPVFRGRFTGTELLKCIP